MGKPIARRIFPYAAVSSPWQKSGASESEEYSSRIKAENRR